MKDWQFWTFIAILYLIAGIFTPFPFDMFFYAIALGLGIATHFIQLKEIKIEKTKFEIQKMLIFKLIADLEEIKELLGKRMRKKSREVNHGNKQKRL